MNKIIITLLVLASSIALADQSTACPEPTVHAVYEGTTDLGSSCQLTYEAAINGCPGGAVDPVPKYEQVIVESENPWFISILFETYAGAGVCDFTSQKTATEQVYRVQMYVEQGAIADELSVQLDAKGVPQSYVLNEAKSWTGGTTFGTTERACTVLKERKVKSFNCKGLHLKN